jgi:hypothetical protein
MDFIDSPAWKLLGLLLGLLMIVTMAYCVRDALREANESEDEE